jgi:hypothetical protein
VKNFKKDKSARQAVAGVGDSASLWFPKARDQYEGNCAVLLVHQGAHTWPSRSRPQARKRSPPYSRSWGQWPRGRCCGSRSQQRIDTDFLFGMGIAMIFLFASPVGK